MSEILPMPPTPKGQTWLSLGPAWLPVPCGRLTRARTATEAARRATLRAAWLGLQKWKVWGQRGPRYREEWHRRLPLPLPHSVSQEQCGEASPTLKPFVFLAVCPFLLVF